MPIITTQRRMAEHGRIRLGQQVQASNGKTRPDKLDRFRFTSASQRLIDEIAAKYGGQAHKWDNAGKAEWEVISDARAIPVIVVKGGFSQWHEVWSKAGCLHRCDGEKDVTGSYCDPDDPLHVQALEKPTTRLSVMLSEIESLGVWRMESHGWNAAAELPSMAELAQVVGDLVPATLSLAERSSIVQTSRGPQTSRFVVPVLDLHVTKARLVELVGGVNGAPQIESGSVPSGAKQLEAGGIKPGYAGVIASAATTDDLNAIWRTAGEVGDLTEDLKAAIIARAGELDPQSPPDDTADADVADDPEDDAAAAWMNVVTIAGQHGWTLYQLEDAFQRHAAIPVSEASTVQISDFLVALRRGDINAPAEATA
jgi:hypothetical protein